MDHFVRGRIYEYIKLKPGQHYNAIRSHLGLNNGTLAYHLKTLEMQKYIKYKRIGFFKCFYPIEYKVPCNENNIKLSGLQIKIFEKIKNKPGINQSDIIQELGSSQQNISYNIKVMERNGIIRTEEVGRTTKYYAVEKDIQNT